PRDRPVSRSRMTFASSTSPNSSNPLLRVSSVVSQLRPPTNSFWGINHRSLHLSWLLSTACGERRIFVAYPWPEAEIPKSRALLAMRCGDSRRSCPVVSNMSNEEWRRPLATGEKCPLCDFGALERVNVPPTLQQI